MKLLLKSVVIVDETSTHHNKKLDIYIEDGQIKEIGKNLKNKADKEVAQENLHVSRGWFDSSVSFGEPGFEDRETIQNGLDAAGKSGFTGVALNPYTNPVLDHSGSIAAVKAKSNAHPVHLFPVGALTIKSEGKDLAELLDMQEAGAVSFGDYKLPLRNPNLLKIALQYAQNLDALIQSYPQENRIAGNGIVNEHTNSTLLGLKGIPNLAEELQITRDLYLLEYTGGKLHIPTISTAKSVKLIKEAKKKGMDVSCSVAIHNLLLNDEELKEFDANSKVLPPLRTKKDSKALIQGLKDGTIDMVTSDHNPIDVEHKKVEFDNALFGSIGLETAFGALCQIFTATEAANILTRGKNRFKIEDHSIETGNLADLSLFLPGEEYTFKKEDIISSSQNSIFLNKELKGKAFGAVTNKGVITH
ncbi:dihydroorotase [Christiangramia salexigens]|uniref:Dihydroorotase n=1 Tax=Christiangramia salexigens TaxID=1913577 RepID=A0A1L3J3I3_9FLAO|nr:dihydroorotase [Christiangramia salexigens]APG59670.1 dihydroorotase [Christiangramia salexigens]